MKLGSGTDGEWTFLDMIAIVSFAVGLQNLEMNITQENLDKQTAEVNEKMDAALKDIHDHLRIQDEKIDRILGGMNAER